MKRTISLILALALLWAVLPGYALGETLRQAAESTASSWRYGPNAVQSINGDGILPADSSHPNATLQGIDVSAWQGVIDWERVKAAGIDFVIIRCGYGMDLKDQDDKYFEYNASECERLGIPYGVYLYSYADSVERASSEADHVLRLIEGHTLSYPVYYDMEDDSTLDGDLPAIAKTFCNKIAAAGYPVGVYSSTYWWNTYLTDSCFDNWYRWVAQYYTSCTYKGEYAMWQYSSSGSVDGIDGPVDLDYQIGYPTDHGNSGRISTDKRTYALGESIWVTTAYDGAEGWVGLFHEGADLTSSDTRPLFRYNISETGNPVDILTTRAELGEELIEGCYTVALFAGSGRSLVATTSIQVTKAVASEQTVPATCTTEGSVTVTYSDGTVSTTVLPALGHAWDEGTVTQKPTDTQNGEMLYTCQRCGATETQVIVRASAEGVIRLRGETRYDTAFKTADALKETLGVDRFDTILVASGESFADALGGSYLAAVKKAPILLTSGETVCKRVADYIEENLASGGTVYILGGTAAVPETMEELLPKRNVVRLAGETRYETNLCILREAGVTPGQEVLVCTGTNFADSLSASATGKPILLVNNGSGSLTEGQRAYLQGLGTGYCIVGGENAVGSYLAAELKALGSVRRLAGTDRYETSVLVAKTFFARPSAAVLGYSENFPDGLCGGALAYSMGIPLVLTKTGKAVAAALYASEYSIDRGYVLGGEGLISDDTVRWIFRMSAAETITVK